MIEINPKKFITDRLNLHYHHKRYTTNYFKKLGLANFIVFQKVFRPDCSPATISTATYLATHKDLFLNKEVCDLGCGSGIFAILMAKMGAKKVVAIDITQQAIRNTLQNAHQYSVQDKLNVRKGDLFDAIENTESFDLIIYNFPCFIATKKGFNPLLYTTTETIVKLYKKINNFLKKDGKLIIASCRFNIRGLEQIDHKKIAEQNKFRFETLCNKPFYYRKRKVGFCALYAFFKKSL